MTDDSNLIRDTLGQRLGLTVRPSGGLEGTLDGAPLQVVAQLLRPSHHHEAGAVLDLQSGTLQPTARAPLQLRVTATLPFTPPLDARLQISPCASFASLQAAHRTGFDQRFLLKAAEPARGAALVPPAAREALDAAFVGDPGVRVNDDGITVAWQRLPPYPTVDEVVAALAPLPRAWHAIVEASRGVSPPAGLEEVLIALGAVALPEGVELRGSPVGLAGALDGVSLSVTVAPFAAGGWFARARVWLRTPLPGAPRIVREDRFGSFDRITSFAAGRGEILIGDTAFDRRFAVRSLRPDLLKATLTKPVRDAMLDLDSLVPVELGAARIDGAGPVKGEERLRTLVAATFGLARAVGARG